MKYLKISGKLILLISLLSQLNLFAENYNIETATIEEDRIEAEARPEIANQIADKWYNKGDKELSKVFDTIYLQYDLENDLEDAEDITAKWYDRGEKDIALEFDKITIESDPSIASDIANDWYERGEKEIALELEKLFLQHFTFAASIIADKWYERGEKDTAFEFDKIYLADRSDMASTIADKWRSRGEAELADKLVPVYDIGTSSMDQDIQETWKQPNLMDKMADKWYERDNKTLAVSFDSAYLMHYPEMLDNIVNKWNARGEKDIAVEFENHPNAATIKLNALIKSGKFAEAEEYGNKVLEYWVSQSDEKIQSNIIEKLTFAVKMNSSYYYEILKSKLEEITEEDIIQNFSKFFENLPLNPTFKDISITDYLTHRAYINPLFLSNFNISLEEARKMLEVDLYELAKKSDITFSILHVIALHAKEDPYYKLDIFYENPLGKGSTVGTYYSSLGRLNINLYPLRSKLLRGNLIHEWTHQLMDILFNNNRDPYAINDEIAEIEWNKTMNITLQKLNEAPEEFKKLSLINPNTTSYEASIVVYDGIKTNYSQPQYGPEAIARFAQMIGSDDYDDPKVKEFLQPIYDYWMQFIQPAIEKYVRDHAKIDTFVSDWERENILDPFYRAEIERDEFERDLTAAAQSEPKKALPISNKWYFRGNIERAVQIDKIILQSAKNTEKFLTYATIYFKWEKRGHPEIAKEFKALMYPDQS